MINATVLFIGHLTGERQKFHNLNDFIFLFFFASAELSVGSGLFSGFFLGRGALAVSRRGLDLLGFQLNLFAS